MGNKILFSLPFSWWPIKLFVWLFFPLLLLNFFRCTFSRVKISCELGNGRVFHWPFYCLLGNFFCSRQLNPFENSQIHVILFKCYTVNTQRIMYGIKYTYMWYENAGFMCTKWYTRMICTTNDAESKWSLILWKNDFLQIEWKKWRRKKQREKKKEKQ